MFTILKYKKSTIYRDIYIKVFADGTVSYITVSTYGVLDNTNNGTSFPEPTRIFKENFEMKVQEGSVTKYSSFRIFLSPFSFSVDQNYHIIELFN